MASRNVIKTTRKAGKHWFILFSCFAAQVSLGGHDFNIRAVEAANEEGKAADEVRLLKYPYPYQAALTINSDIDSGTVEKFNAVHSLINTSQTILSGSEASKLLFTDEVERKIQSGVGIKGFGLPVADTFWLFAPGIGVFERFDYTIGKPVTQAHRGRDLREIVDGWFLKGWIDSIHCPGPRDIRRESSMTGFAWLAEQPHRRARVWVNHSSANAPANVGPESRRVLVFVAKNLVKIATGAFRWVGLESYVRRPMAFPENQRAIMWPVSILLVLSCLFPIICYWFRPLKKMHYWIVSGSCLASFVVGMYFVPVRYHLGDNIDSQYYCADLAREHGTRFYWLLNDVPGCQSHVPNQLALPEQLVGDQSTILRVARFDDGSSGVIFPRCYKGAGGVKSLELLNRSSLEELVNTGSTAIIYTHWTAKPKKVFTASALYGLRVLSELYEAGRIWVAPTSDILHFTFIRTYLEYEVIREPGKLVVQIQKLRDPTGDSFMPTLEDLSGLSFDCPSDTTIELRLGEQVLPPFAFRIASKGERMVVQF